MCEEAGVLPSRMGECHPNGQLGSALGRYLSFEERGDRDLAWAREWRARDRSAAGSLAFESYVDR